MVQLALATWVEDFFTPELLNLAIRRVAWVIEHVLLEHSVGGVFCWSLSLSCWRRWLLVAI